MQILKNQTILQRQSENYIKGELSNVATVIQSPQILVTYFPINVDATTTITGLKNVSDYVGPDSHVVYDKINHLPMSGVDNLISQSQFDEELGFEEDFQSSGVIFPNTIYPKPNDFFQIESSEINALYIVTGITPVTVRSNPFVEISFRLFTRDGEIIKQLYRQVRDEYETTVTAIGLDKSLVIKKSALYDVQHHVEQYLDVVDMYQTLFYDHNKSAFVFDGLPGIDGGGCMGYMSQSDITDAALDPNHPHHSIISSITELQNGAVINERGDRFYVVEGDPIIVPGYVPYWLVRNHVNQHNQSISDCHCQTCKNKTCGNCDQNAWYDRINSLSGEKIVRQVFVDMTLWKFMFDEGIVIFDDVITYANNNLSKNIERLYMDCPDIYVDEHSYKRSVLYRLYTKDHKHNPMEFCHPQCCEADPRIAKFQGKNIYHLERYDKTRDCSLNCGYYNIWDEEFQERLKTGEPYPVCSQDITIASQCMKRIYPFDVYLRNTIILAYNNKPIDWDNVQIEYDRTIENYTLIPLVLSYYKDYIKELQR